MEIVGVGEQGLFRATYAVIQAATRREFPSAIPLDEAWRLVESPPAEYRFSCLAAVDDDEVVGGAWLTWSLAENRQLLVAELGVEAGRRRQGVGSALLDAVKAAGLADGRNALLCETFSPYGDGPGAGAAFAEARGFTQQYAALHQVLDFPVAGLAEKAAEIAPHHRDYSLATWPDGCPEEYVEQYCGLLSLIDDEVPLDDLEIEAKRWTPERLRSVEARRRTAGHLTSTTVAIAPDGILAGYTELTGKPQQPNRLDQHDTLVRPEHRGHRLGLALKIANLQALHARTAGPATIHTTNAAANAPMIAVNTQLGFRPVEHQHLWVATLD
ncbi:acetyltransferase (GNAT) family protein [Kribbella voronezhensis]|uniref:Acetyltransferase (GNAT) family protein n=1 Tax=Kribbella voronezhensis TaxID=2512212 RepID=A0A4R7T6Y5_9ACTN|nr:GNAT family N-acetyltransferase [Kribbella voronezhensis]TDU87634.1 acetyltransferase (GNAT) family protein [Kribbella voronezhensis]